MTSTLCRRISYSLLRSRWMKSTLLYQQRCSCSSLEAADPSPNEFTDVIESKEDFKYVQRLLPQLEVPSPPKHAQYPTPSGWVPQKEPSPDCPYYIRRTRFHSWPVYAMYKDGGGRQITTVNKIEGNIWELEKDLTLHLEGIMGEKVHSQVNEIGMFISYKGIFVQEVKDWLRDNGF
ncbi:large ribosomal subunit protein mL49-like [Glandiceps talaboti]